MKIEYKGYSTDLDIDGAGLFRQIAEIGRFFESVDLHLAAEDRTERPDFGVLGEVKNADPGWSANSIIDEALAGSKGGTDGKVKTDLPSYSFHADQPKSPPATSADVRALWEAIDELRGREQSTSIYYTASASQIASSRRAEALDLAVKNSSLDDSPQAVVARAQAFEAYLKGHDDDAA